MGPLQNLRVVEFAGTGPVPFCAMLLSDMGADVVRIDRPGKHGLGMEDPVTSRGRRSVVLDLKGAPGREGALRLIERADVVLEGFRPGVMERLALGPEVCHARKPALVYGRMTGWGQHGPMAQRAGHDINYIAVTGVLHQMARAGGKPLVPLNLVGDYGGGGMLLAFGVVSALLERQQSGHGQVVDAAMSDGSALLMSLFYGLRARGLWPNEPGGNLLDGGAPFYDTYVCADGRHLAVGALEPQFYRRLLEQLGLSDEDDLQRPMDPATWPRIRERFSTVFRSRDRDAWCAALAGVDACVAPVLSMDEAPDHPHNRARATFVEYAGITQPAPAPRFSRTKPCIRGPAVAPGEGAEQALADWGVELPTAAGSDVRSDCRREPERDLTPARREDTPMNETRYSVRIVDTGEHYTCAASQNLLKAMLALGRKGIPSGCHGGGCGVCKVRLIEGSADVGRMSRAHVSVEEQAQGYVLACQAFPRSDIVLEVVGGMRKSMLRHQPRRYGFV